MLESKFQADLIKDLEDLFPGCVVMKNDANYRQGFPDLLVLYYSRWAALEVKASAKASHQPNQDYWIDRLSKEGFADFIYPENKIGVLRDLAEYFG